MRFGRRIRRKSKEHEKIMKEEKNVERLLIDSFLLSVLEVIYKSSCKMLEVPGIKLP